MKKNRANRVHMLVWNTFLNDARVYNEAQTTQHSGYSVTVHALAYAGMPRTVEYLANGVCVHRHGRDAVVSKSDAVFGKLAALIMVLRRFKVFGSMALANLKARPDLLHVHDVNMLPLGWLLARLTGAALVYDAHEISTHREGYQPVRGWVGWLEKHLMPKAAGCITTTNTRATFFARAYGITRPLVLQNRPRCRHITKSNQIRDELGLSESWPIVLYQGGLQQGRGLLRLVEAALAVPGAYFVFIGGGRQETELHAMTTRLGLSKRVHFIPTVPLNDLHKYTASADIGIQPIENTCLNHFSTDSNKLFEYVIAGLPVIASAMPEIRIIVQKYDLGLSVAPGDTQALVDALNTLVNNSHLRQHYAEQSVRAALHLNWEAQEQSLLDLYARVLS